MFLEVNPPLIIAHRGSSLHAPENTLAAFDLALRHGADAIELDAKLSKDGYVLVIHDQTVDRTTSASGKVSDMTLEKLKKLDAGSHFDITFQGEPIPTLDEVFETVGKQIIVNVELTNLSTPFDSLPEKVAEIILRHNLAHNTLVSSFNPLALRKIKYHLPETPIGLLVLHGFIGKPFLGRLGRIIVPYHTLHPETGAVTPQLVKRTHQLGRRIFVYTVNQVNDMQRLFIMGVDGIFTDDPLLARQVLASVNQ
jgi:glycerophosphoryl diester phosphodiesterase